jgi:chromo domain-containing protein 1
VLRGFTDSYWHRCTWEPVEHLENTNLLEVWDKKFVELGEAAFTKLAHDNHVEYEAAVQHVAAAKAHRQRLRAKKRQMLESSGKKEENTKASPFIIIDSDSDSDTPLMNSAGASHGAHFTRETRPPRRQVLQPSKSLDSEDSKDPLMKQLRTKDSEAERRKPPQKPMELIWKPQRVTKQSRTKDSEAELLKPPQKPIKLTWNPQRAKDQSGSLKRSEKRSSHATESSSKSVPEKLNDPKDKTLDDESRPSRNSPTRTCISSGQRSRKGSGQLSWQPDAVANAPAASTLRQNSKAVGNTSILALRPSSPDQVERPKQFMRKSAPTIRMLNEPKTGHLKAAWHKGGVQETYSKIRYRRKAELRGRHEATPDPSVLLFVNAPPGLTPRRSDQTNGNPYGRRDPVDLRAPRPNDSDDEFAAPSTTNVSDLEKDKVPLTCFDWRNGSCPYNAETCRFLHRDTAKIGPADGYEPKPRDHIYVPSPRPFANYCIVLFHPNTGDQRLRVLIG